MIGRAFYQSAQAKNGHDILKSFDFKSSERASFLSLYFSKDGQGQFRMIHGYGPVPIGPRNRGLIYIGGRKRKNLSFSS